MKVKIGNYTSWIGPFQIADKIFFWCDKHAYDEKLLNRWDHKLKDQLGDFLAYGFNKEPVRKDGKEYWNDGRKRSWFNGVCEWVHSKQKRNVKVHIDKWDTWSMDHTLSYIIAPMLKQLKDTKHGAPYTDDDDVPEELKSTSAAPKENEYDTDANHFKRWDYILDEMIWAFEQHMLDDEPDFWIKEPEGMYFEPCEDNSNLSTMKYDKEGEFDQEAYNAYHVRKANGFKMFGKYYLHLWD